MPAAVPAPSSARTVRREAILGAALFFGLFAWIFQDVLVRGRLLSYRDALQFYYPLFQLIREEWSAGRVPLWNPYSNCGQPLLAIPTSCALYPLLGVFFLPVSYWAQYHLYVLLHVIIAGTSCGWVARRWGCSLPAATLAAISYAFCGNVLFQYSNVVFLCGAAWLPLALWSGDRMLRERSLARVPLFAGLLALMTLAGDAELAYLAGFSAALQVLLLRRNKRSSGMDQPAQDEVKIRPDRVSGRGTPRLLLLGLAAVLALGLAAPQVLPTLDGSRETVRASRQTPASLYDIPGYLLRESALRVRPDTQQPSRWYEGLLGDPPPPARHESMVYQFSFVPPRIIEFLWPNVAGRLFPEDHLWLWVFKWDGMSWVASQYMGLLPFLLAVASLRWRRAESRRVWLSWIALLSFLASFGRYGPGTFFLEPTPLEQLRHDPGIMTGGVGGAYWLMTLLLPGFSEFRYPSKLLVLTACALSLLSAFGFDRLLHGTAASLRRWRRGFLLLLVTSIVLAIGIDLYGGRWFAAWLRRYPELRPRFTPEGALQDIFAALCHGAVLSFAIWFALRRLRTPDSGGASRGTWKWALVLISTIELGVANIGLVNTTDRAEWERTPSLVTSLNAAALAREVDPVRPLRVLRLPDWHQPIASSTQVVRQPLIVRWQRATLQPIQNLPFHLAYPSVFGTMDSFPQATWFDHLQIKPDTYLQARRSCDAWGVNFFVLPAADLPSNPVLSTVGLKTKWRPPRSDDPLERILPLGEPLENALPDSRSAPADVPDVDVLYNDSAFPPAWIVHRIEPMPDIEPWDQKQWLTHLSELVHPLHERVWDLRAEASVQSSKLLERLGSGPVEWPATPGAESCRLMSYSPQVVEVEAKLSADGMVVLSDTWTHDWKARVSTNGGEFREVPLHRANVTMRGVLLPAGAHVIQYVYEPRSFRIGVMLCGLSLLGIAAGLVVRRGRRRATASPR